MKKLSKVRQIRSGLLDQCSPVKHLILEKLCWKRMHVVVGLYMYGYDYLWLRLLHPNKHVPVPVVYKSHLSSSLNLLRLISHDSRSENPYSSLNIIHSL